MNFSNIFFSEWRHLRGNPLKLLSIILFMIASVYGMINSKYLYEKQNLEIFDINKKLEQEINDNLNLFKSDNPRPKERPWIDLSIPDWAIWYTKVYHFNNPSPLIIFSVGQAEQYAFYKKITYMSSPYDKDMTNEISNPERLEIGSLDFSFSVIYLLPLLMIILLFNLKTKESESKILNLVKIQVKSAKIWLIIRIFFYLLILVLLNLFLLIFGILLFDISKIHLPSVVYIFTYLLIYILFWGIIFYFILKISFTIIESSVMMIGIWLTLTLLIPSLINQYLSVKHPNNSFLGYIDAVRDEKKDIYNLSDSIAMSKLIKLYPEIKETINYNSLENKSRIINESKVALLNQVLKKKIETIEIKNKNRNTFIKKFFIVNPISFFQNKLNQLTRTHYDNYANYRKEIQFLIDLQIRTMIIDTWNGVEVDYDKFKFYHDLFRISKKK